ncbi:hypothetical protein B7H23_07710 [Notoacmeibacter marinus]|uniref:Uncharacterized protein n=1 Tax=Notoacmeibacter marinus TaxID=1876515 RepID=A0A231V3J7_9HYPH|nr:hypothetical protein B7H23_07710 [Notoacmeibacter marinus]
MTTEKIKSASEVLTDFLDAQAKKAGVDSGTIVAIRDLRSESKLTKTNLLRKLEDTRKAALKGAKPPAEEDAGND